MPGLIARLHGSARGPLALGTIGVIPFAETIADAAGAKLSVGDYIDARQGIAGLTRIDLVLPNGGLSRAAFTSSGASVSPGSRLQSWQSRSKREIALGARPPTGRVASLRATGSTTSSIEWLWGRSELVSAACR